MGQKRHFAFLQIKLTLSLIKVCYKVYVTTFRPSSDIVENSALSNGATKLGENVTVASNISPQINSLTLKSAELDVISVVVSLARVRNKVQLSPILVSDDLTIKQLHYYKVLKG